MKEGLVLFHKLSLYFRNVPKNPESVYEPFSQEIIRLMEGNLISLVSFGSASSGDYIYGYSNINIAMVLKNVTLGHLKQLCLPIERWMVRGFAPPLIFTPKDLERSLDSLSVLFLDIRDNHHILFGDDVFKNLVIGEKDLRVQVEQKLKILISETRTEFLKSGESLSTFEGMISRSFNDLYPLIRGLLVLKKASPSIRKDVVIAMAEEHLKLDPGILTDALRHKMGIIRLSEKHQLLTYFEKYLAVLENLSDIADSL